MLQVPFVFETFRTEMTGEWHVGRVDGHVLHQSVICVEFLHADVTFEFSVDIFTVDPDVSI